MKLYKNVWHYIKYAYWQQFQYQYGTETVQLVQLQVWGSIDINKVKLRTNYT